MLNQIIFLLYSRLVSSEKFAKEYLFSNTSYIYKPLWAIDIENRGAKVSIYFYSANCQTPKILNTQKDFFYGYNLLSWQNFYVWTKAHKAFIIDKINYKAKVNIVGGIDFLDTENNLNLPKNKYIGVWI